MEKFKAAAYCRLSRDDEHSGSIENQRLLIENYISAHSDEFELTEVYADDGITGMTYERAAYLRMMEAVSKHRINAIIVKDLSRIGREQIETLNLIKREFILKNIRFIAITDDYDSFDSASRDGLSTSVKLLLNDYYCADISKKVRSAQKVKRERGDFIGSHAPYGYLKDPKNKNRLITDKAAAEVVKRIFMLFLSGHGKQAIARILNAEAIPNPTLYKQSVLKQNYKNSNRLADTGHWTYSTIHKILQNRVYIGDTVQHRSEIKAYNIHKRSLLPSDEWCIVENTHAPIIDSTDFYNVQALLKTRTKTPDFSQNISKYNGLFFCGDCGRAMNKYLSRQKKDGSRYTAFKCGSYSRLGKDVCTSHSLKESELDEIVLSALNPLLPARLDEETCEYIKQNASDLTEPNIQDRLARLRQALASRHSRRKTMLRHLAQGTISAEDFGIFDSEDKNGTALLCSKIAQAEKMFSEEKARISCGGRTEDILSRKSIKSLTREILVGLIDKIYITEKDEKKEIEICFKFPK